MPETPRGVVAFLTAWVAATLAILAWWGVLVCRPQAGAGRMPRQRQVVVRQDSAA